MRSRGGKRASDRTLFGPNECLIFTVSSARAGRISCSASGASCCRCSPRAIGISTTCVARSTTDPWSGGLSQKLMRLVNRRVVWVPISRRMGKQRTWVQGKGDPIIFVHGNGSTHKAWTGVITEVRETLYQRSVMRRPLVRPANECRNRGSHAGYRLHGTLTLGPSIQHRSDDNTVWRSDLFFTYRTGESSVVTGRHNGRSCTRVTKSEHNGPILHRLPRF
jgi:hypothetical protein